MSAVAVVPASQPTLRAWCRFVVVTSLTSNLIPSIDEGWDVGWDVFRHDRQLRRSEPDSIATTGPPEATSASAA